MVTAEEILRIAREIKPAVKKDDTLITSGMYNSIEMVSFVVKLEAEYGVRISPMDINARHFNTVGAIAKLVEMYLNDEERQESSKIVVNIHPEELAEDARDEESSGNGSTTASLSVGRSFQGIIKPESPAEKGIEDFRYPEETEHILDFLTNSASQVPEKDAVIDAYGNVLSFSVLLEQSQAVGTYLQNKYGCTGRPFVVIGQRNVKSIVMFLGVAWSGNYYIPLDGQLPFGRIEEMVSAIEPEAVLWNFHAGSEEILDLDADVEIFDEMLAAAPNKKLLKSIQKGITGDTPLFGVYTSGTTEHEKCVLKSHGAMASFIRRYVSLFGFSHGDVLGSKLSLMFDAVTKDIYTMLYCGAKMYIMPVGNVLPVDDAAFIEAAGITAAVWSPSLLRVFKDLHILESFRMPTLKKVLFVGEELQAKCMNYWLEKKPDALYVNLYGTTEMTGNCLYKIIKEPVLSEVVPLSEVFPGYEVFLLDEEEQDIKESGSVGELCVAGELLCSGLQLLPHGSSLVYHTGDMMRLDGDGSYVFAAREGFYFKHFGYRINPGEIEACLEKTEFVEIAVCVYDDANSRIVLFWQGDAEKEEELSAFAARELPSYMVPGRYVHVQDMPLNRNGKVDRAELVRRLRV